LALPQTSGRYYGIIHVQQAPARSPDSASGALSGPNLSGRL
jgi:hypothetical protein